MSERNDQTARHTDERPDSVQGSPHDRLHCGDCRMPLAPQQPHLSEPGVYYCPGCAKQAAEPLSCPHCGSLICPGCGTPLESADDLGIG